MKVTNILTETVNTKLTESYDFNELSSLHIAALKAINDGRMDIDNASDRMFDMVYELIHNGLVTNDITLTPAGERAIELAQELGGSKERRRAAAQKDVEVDISDIYNTGDEDEFDVDMSPYQPNRFGTPHQMY